MSKPLRDPIYGLIVFDEADKLSVDPLTWSLIDTPEFQRLRRIRQLGVSQFTFPGTVRTSFAHSIGVFHEEIRQYSQHRARRLVVDAWDRMEAGSEFKALAL